MFFQVEEDIKTEKEAEDAGVKNPPKVSLIYDLCSSTLLILEFRWCFTTSMTIGLRIILEPGVTDVEYKE
jgi:hypothetical protein